MLRTALLLAALAAASANVKVTPASDTSLKASWTAPPSDGGAAITKYKVDWDTNGGLAETQVITTSADGAMGGTFALSFRGHRSNDVAADASAETVKSALEDLPTVGKVNVSRTGPTNFGYSWTVRFLTNVGDVPSIVVHTSSLTPATKAARVDELDKGGSPNFDQGTVGITVLPLGSVEVERRQEVQTIYASADAADLSGFFKASFMGEVPSTSRSTPPPLK
jgi:hypothetical protein